MDPLHRPASPAHAACPARAASPVHRGRVPETKAWPAGAARVGSCAFHLGLAEPGARRRSGSVARLVPHANSPAGLLAALTNAFTAVDARQWLQAVGLSLGYAAFVVAMLYALLVRVG